MLSLDWTGLDWTSFHVLFAYFTFRLWSCDDGVWGVFCTVEALLFSSFGSFLGVWVSELVFSLLSLLGLED